MNGLIMQTLQSTGVPVTFQTYEGTETTYITFFEFQQRSGLNADDMEQQTIHSVQVDVWSIGNYSDLVDQVRQLMMDAGFKRTYETEIYEKDTKIFHKVFRFNNHT